MRINAEHTGDSFARALLVGVIPRIWSSSRCRPPHNTICSSSNPASPRSLRLPRSAVRAASESAASRTCSARNPRLVRIDVEVTDRSGKPIKGLRADQFAVTDDGKPQKISSFSYSDIEEIETAGSETTRSPLCARR